MWTIFRTTLKLAHSLETDFRNNEYPDEKINYLIELYAGTNKLWWKARKFPRVKVFVIVAEGNDDI